MKLILYGLVLGFLLLSLPTLGVNLSQSPVSVMSESLSSSELLLGEGARWAAGVGVNALLVDFYDSVVAHPNEVAPDPTIYLPVRASEEYALEQAGLNVTLAGDIPTDLSAYDVVIIHAYWACEPDMESAIRNYISNGGGVVVVEGTPCYFAYYSKDFSTGTNLSLIDEWFGASAYRNGNGDAYVTVSNPFGTSFQNGDVIVAGFAGSGASMVSVHPDAQVIAQWSTGDIFAFTHEYAQGRVYYQAKIEPASQEPPSSIASLLLLGGGAKWAADGGVNALLVDFYDSVVAHPNEVAPDPTIYLPVRASEEYALEQAGLNVTLAGDIPTDLSAYDVVIIHAYWACEPSNEPVIRNYISSGGGVVLIEGTPCYFAHYCKDFGAGGDLGQIEDWFGAPVYQNANGDARVIVDDPFGTSFQSGDVIVAGFAGSGASMVSVHPDAQVIAQWSTGDIFAFTHEYAQGRVYYQAKIEPASEIPPLNIPAVEVMADMCPSVLNLGNRGLFIASYIQLPAGYDVTDIDVSTVVLNATIHAELASTAGDFNNDTVPDLMVTFNRSQVASFIMSRNISIGSLTLIVTGKLYNDTSFEGTDSIAVRMPGDVNIDGKVDVKDVYVAAQEFGTHLGDPRWNAIVDENEDGKIDIRDYYVVCRDYGKTYP